MNIEELRKFRTVTRLCIGAGAIIFLLLIGFESLPIDNGNELQIYYLSSSQQWLVQRISKDALLMQNGTPTLREQAVSELQVEIPRWIANETQLNTLRLPVDVQVLYMSSASDYTAITAAATSILSHPTEVADPIEVAIVLNHEPDYFLNLSQIVAVLRQNITSSLNILFWFEMFLGCILFSASIFYWINVERIIWHARKQESLNEQIS